LTVCGSPANDLGDGMDGRVDLLIGIERPD
jgi:hypothetical protein